jgi:hypothetical protein
MLELSQDGHQQSSQSFSPQLVKKNILKAAHGDSLDSNNDDDEDDDLDEFIKQDDGDDDLSVDMEKHHHHNFAS